MVLLGSTIFVYCQNRTRSALFFPMGSQRLHNVICLSNAGNLSFAVSTNTVYIGPLLYNCKSNLPACRQIHFNTMNCNSWLLPRTSGFFFYPVFIYCISPIYSCAYMTQAKYVKCYFLLPRGLDFLIFFFLKVVF